MSYKSSSCYGLITHAEARKNHNTVEPWCRGRSTPVELLEPALDMPCREMRGQVETDVGPQYPAVRSRGRVTEDEECRYCGGKDYAIPTRSGAAPRCVGIAIRRSLYTLPLKCDKWRSPRRGPPLEAGRPIDLGHMVGSSRSAASSHGLRIADSGWSVGHFKGGRVERLAICSGALCPEKEKTGLLETTLKWL